MMTENYLQNNQNLNLQLYHFSLGIQGEYNSRFEGESKSFNSLKRFGQALNNITTNSNNITGDLNLTGAAILSDNLNLNIQGNLNKKDLQDTYYSESYGFGLQVAIPIGGKNSNSTSSSTPTPSTNNSVNNQSPAQPSPKGSTTISASYQQNEAKRTTYATIGSLSDYQNGSLALVSDTKTMINGDFSANLTIDHRLFSESGRADIAREAKELPKNIGIIAKDVDKGIEAVGSTPYVGKIIRNTITSPAEGLIDYFYEDESKLYAKNSKAEVVITNNPASKRNYAINGIMTPLDTALTNYLGQEGTDNLVLRYNPTSGFLGDLVESGLGKTLGMIAPQTSAMARLETQDFYQRGGIPEASNIAHSQGSIITSNAIKLYNKTYAQGFDLNGERLPRWQDTQINQSQTFNAVGPAVYEGSWNNLTYSLGENINKNSAFEHKPNDSIKPITSPTSPLDFAKGILNLINIQDHDVKNYEYSYYFLDQEYKEQPMLY
jgi:hypothetical protein